MKKIIAISLILLTLTALVSCDLDSARTVRFYASSTSGLVTGNYYWSGGMTMFNDRTSPWSIEVETEKGDQVILTVTNSLGTGTIVARIYVDDVLFRENTGIDMDIIQVAGYVE